MIFVHHFSEKHRKYTIKIDKAGDVISFPAVYKFSWFNNLVTLFFPIFRANSISEIKLSELKKCCVYNTKKIFFVELYAPEKLLILQFFNEEDAMKFVEKLRETSPDLYWDEFNSGEVRRIKTCCQLVILCSLLLSFDVISPIDMLSAKIEPYLLPHKIETQLRFYDLDKDGWKFDSVSDIGKVNKNYIATVNLKKYGRTEKIKIQYTGGIGEYLGEDMDRFNILRTMESALKEAFGKKMINKNAKLEDLYVVHVVGNRYYAFGKVSIKGNINDMHIMVKDNGKSISWDPIGSSKLLLL